MEEFVKRTGCDSLAIAIGTSHGAFKFKGEPKLRFDILEEVAKRLPGFPIVLHGASSVVPEYVEMINKFGGSMPGAQGVPESMLRKAASLAVCKINIDSDLRLAFTAEVRRHFAEHPDHFDPRQYLTRRARRHPLHGAAQDRKRAGLQRQSLSPGRNGAMKIAVTGGAGFIGANYRILSAGKSSAGQRDMPG